MSIYPKSISSSNNIVLASKMTNTDVSPSDPNYIEINTMAWISRCATGKNIFFRNIVILLGFRRVIVINTYKIENLEPQ